MMKKEQIKALLLKYESGTCTADERALLETWFLRQHIAHIPTSDEMDEDLNAVWAGLNKDYQKPAQIISWPRITAAASILLFLSVGSYFLLRKQPPQQTAQNQIHDLAPGSNKAILTLSSGKQIVLNNTKKGQIAHQGNTTVNKTSDGSIKYISGSNANGEIAYNTVTTPRGSQYRLTLSDGTNVWLDAASSIKYPTNFTGSDRKVEITGEAYFEVAHNPQMPFSVRSYKQVVEVLGTHFNVNAYSDEPNVKTTLLEGSVKIISGSNNAIIKPGQQAIVTGEKLTIQDADTEEATAWKDGMFRFSGESLENIMRKISRWYNVDIEYADNDVKSIPFNGIITHFTDANKVLRMLERTNEVHFKIQGKKIIVMK